jgi:hypothetical protein
MAFLVSFAVVFMAIMVRAFVPFPTVVVCDRRAPNAEVKASSTRAYGYFEKRYVGPRVMYST